jgi:hypothetical protein
MMWWIFKKRHEGDLRKLVSAYRYFLKAASQAEGLSLLDEAEKEARKWKGGFGKAFNQLFYEWPTPHESKRFERRMERWLKKIHNTDQAFIHAFNEYLDQKRLSPEELHEVLNQGRRDFNG